MATTSSAETLQILKTRRTWRTNIESPDGQIPVITGHREILTKTADGATLIARHDAGAVNRSLAAVAAETVTLASGKVLTGAEVGEAVSRFLDQWDEADLAAAAAAVAAAAAAAAEQPTV